MSEEGVERRLTTILAADVVGYSRLMAADEAGTFAQLKTHRKELIEPKTAEYHGRVVKRRWPASRPRVRSRALLGRRHPRVSAADLRPRKALNVRYPESGHYR